MKSSNRSIVQLSASPHDFVLKSPYHLLNLCVTRRGAVAPELGVIALGGLEALISAVYVVQEQVTESQPIEGVSLLVVMTEQKVLLELRKGLLVLLEGEVALCGHIIVECALVGGECLQPGKHAVNELDGPLIVPLVVVAHAHVGREAGIEPLAAFQLLEQGKRLPVLAPLEIVDGASQHLTIPWLFLCPSIQRQQQ